MKVRACARAKHTGREINFDWIALSACPKRIEYRAPDGNRTRDEDARPRRLAVSHREKASENCLYKLGSDVRSGAAPKENGEAGRSVENEIIFSISFVRPSEPRNLSGSPHARSHRLLHSSLIAPVYFSRRATAEATPSPLNLAAIMIPGHRKINPRSNENRRERTTDRRKQRWRGSNLLYSLF